MTTRGITLKVRLTEDEAKRLRERAEAMDVSMSTLVRLSALGSPTAMESAALVRALAPLAANLTRIVRSRESDGVSIDNNLDTTLTAVLAALDEARLRGRA